MTLHYLLFFLCTILLWYVTVKIKHFSPLLKYWHLSNERLNLVTILSCPLDFPGNLFIIPFENHYSRNGYRFRVRLTNLGLPSLGRLFVHSRAGFLFSGRKFHSRKTFRVELTATGLLDTQNQEHWQWYCREGNTTLTQLVKGPKEGCTLTQTLTEQTNSTDWPVIFCFYLLA